MKIYITGISGTGKSTIAKELTKKGFYVIDIDEVSGLCHWQHKKTLERVDYHSGVSKEWLKNHEWICDTEKLKELFANHEKMALVGMPKNQNELLPLFDKVFLLQCSKDTFLKRLNARTGVDEFGKTKDEQEYILSMYEDFENKMVQQGAISLNTEESIGAVIDKILQ